MKLEINTLDKTKPSVSPSVFELVDFFEANIFENFILNLHFILLDKKLYKRSELHLTDLLQMRNANRSGRMRIIKRRIKRIWR